MLSIKVDKKESKKIWLFWEIASSQRNVNICTRTRRSLSMSLERECDNENMNRERDEWMSGWIDVNTSI